MKKSAVFIIFAVILPFLLLPTALALPNDDKVRLIAHTTSNLDKISFKLKGCEITHELRDATSVACPKGVTIPNSEPDAVLHVLDLTSNHQINADHLGLDGTGTTIAVLDTGIDYTNAQLSSSSGSNDPVNGRCFAVTANDCANGFFDDFGHGTHVSGIISSYGIADSNNGAFSKGVASGTKIWMAKVCDASGSCYNSDIIAAIQYIVNNHISKVMSMSFGGGGTTASNCDNTRDILAPYINWAYNNGVVSVVAAGNSGNNIVGSPACASYAIAVAAVDSSDTRASFSSYGKALQDHGVAAPGVNIYSTVPTGSCPLCSPTSYSYLSGTSMATPHVSAIVALMLQKNPNLTPAAIRSTIFSSANCLNNKYGPCPNIYIGYGRVDALAATTPTLSVSANPSALTTTQTSTITALTSDGKSGVIISFTVTQGSLDSSSCTTDLTGKCSVIFNSSTTGTATISASNSSYTSGSTTVTVTKPSLSVSANPSTIYTTQTSTITASTSDKKSGVIINFVKTLGSLNSISCVSDSTGKCSVIFNSSTIGTATISASNSSYTSGSTNVRVRRKGG